MNIGNLDRKASWALMLVIALTLSIQQYRVHSSHQNELAAEKILMRYVMENHELKRGGHK